MQQCQNRLLVLLHLIRSFTASLDRDHQPELPMPPFPSIESETKDPRLLFNASPAVDLPTKPQR